MSERGPRAGDDDAAAAFEAQRPMLLGLSYRILGSRADAEDAVQDTWLKWRDADRGAIENPGAWLTSACARRCIDISRAAHRRRVEYVGAWLPEPLHTAGEGSAEEHAALASSLTTAFLLVLERLSPKERAAFLLHEVFDVPYPEVARTLEIAEPACRKLVSRARSHVEQADARYVAPRERQDELLAAFTAAIADGDTARLTSLLADDVELSVDSGGKVPALREVLRGKESVLAFVARGLHTYWSAQRRELVDLNAGRGMLVRTEQGINAAVSFAYDRSGAVRAIYIVRNPDKLAGLGGVVQ